VKFVLRKRVFSTLHHSNDAIRNARILHPKRAGLRAVQMTVNDSEALARSCLGGDNFFAPRGFWE
jgi:hypothetical protein